MLTMRKIVPILVVAVLALLLGGWLTNSFFSFTKTHTRANADVLLERIQTVTKLVTVEGYFSEIYSHEDYSSFDISPFRKKALLRVKAKASVGFDLSEMKVEAFPESGKIVISNLPDPKILSMDHDVDYYDIQEGTFNSFSARDYTEINRKAKEYIRQIAESDESGLLLAAEEQMNNIQQTIEIMIETAGWEVEYKKVYEDEPQERMAPTENIAQ